LQYLQLSTTTHQFFLFFFFPFTCSTSSSQPGEKVLVLNTGYFGDRVSIHPLHSIHEKIGGIVQWASSNS
jgi:hypothetical protein